MLLWYFFLRFVVLLLLAGCSHSACFCLIFRNNKITIKFTRSVLKDNKVIRFIACMHFTQNKYEKSQQTIFFWKKTNRCGNNHIHMKQYSNASHCTKFRISKRTRFFLLACKLLEPHHTNVNSLYSQSIFTCSCMQLLYIWSTMTTKTFCFYIKNKNKTESKKPNKNRQRLQYTSESSFET